MNWFARHAPAIEAAAAVVTALVAVAALVGVSIQLDEADRLSREQSAREAYRGHLALAVAHPEYAQPQDACGMLTGPQAGSYGAFVDHLLYSAEQQLSVEAGWEPTFLDALTPHAAYFCSAEGPPGETPETAALLTRFRAQICGAVSACE